MKIDPDYIDDTWMSKAQHKALQKKQELRQIIQILPELKERAMRFELAYRREAFDNIGREENGYIYHVRPTVFKNYINSEKEYADYDKRRWDLIQELGLTCSVSGIPDFGDSEIKPYGLSDEEKYKMEQRFNFNSPIGRQ